MTTLSEIPKVKFIRLFVSVFTFSYPFLLSPPFFMLYLIFSLPYILEFLSLVSPVFITASILLFAFVTSLTNKIIEQCPKNDLGFLLYAHHVVHKIFLSYIDEGDEEFYHVEALELYKIVFETSMMEETEDHVDYTEEQPEEKIVQAVEASIMTILQNDDQECIRNKDETFSNPLKGDFLDNGELKKPVILVRERILQDSLEEVNEFKFLDCKEVDKSQKPEEEMVKQDSTKKRHSRRRSTRSNTELLGRMPLKENEWKMTLACKIFEEKNSNNVEGSEGMDLLWETHEEERDIGTSRNEMKNENEGPQENTIEYNEDDEDEEEEEEEEIDVHVCCLPALKFSRGKMNMGVGGRNIARISKLVRGIRWLRSVTKHGKKM